MHAAATFENLLGRASDAALVVDGSGTIRFINDQACKLFKYLAGELDGQSLELLVPYRNRLTHIGERLRFTDDHRTRPMGAGLELFALCKDGSERRVDISLSPVQRGLESLVIATIRPHEFDSPTASGN
jgi:PAS domain S-box-containing protein